MNDIKYKYINVCDKVIKIQDIGEDKIMLVDLVRIALTIEGNRNAIRFCSC